MPSSREANPFQAPGEHPGRRLAPWPRWLAIPVFIVTLPLVLVFLAGTVGGLFFCGMSIAAGDPESAWYLVRANALPMLVAGAGVPSFINALRGIRRKPRLSFEPWPVPEEVVVRRRSIRAVAIVLYLYGVLIAFIGFVLVLAQFAPDPPTVGWLGRSGTDALFVSIFIVGYAAERCATAWWKSRATPGAAAAILILGHLIFFGVLVAARVM